MMEPPVEDLLDRVDSKFTLVSLAAMRGRQINSYFNQLGEGLGTIVPPQVTSVSRKPLSISLEEIAAGKITYARTDEDSEGDEGEKGAVEERSEPDQSAPDPDPVAKADPEVGTPDDRPDGPGQADPDDQHDASGDTESGPVAATEPPPVVEQQPEPGPPAGGDPLAPMLAGSDPAADVDAEADLPDGSTTGAPEAEVDQ
jgi:DNA-directed RNA polymerase subunit omega